MSKSCDDTMQSRPNSWKYRFRYVFFEALGNDIDKRYANYIYKSPNGFDKNENNYVSVKEAFEYAEGKIMSKWFIDDNNYKPREPQISDLDNIASKLYLGEHKPTK